MKKTLAAAITSALVIGVASTTFAAANPFSDVPTDHWSFDAVAKLAHEGVIEGYGDNTFRGDAKITRYEMAQMVAKAMAKSNVSAADKATIDKLSAEYASELNNLGVRVSALEKKTDNVKINGILRLDNNKYEQVGSEDTKASAGKLRLDITAKVNDDWAVKGRLDGDVDLKDGGTNDGTKVVRAYAEGPLFGATAKIGETYLTDMSLNGLVMDTEFSGAQFNYKGKVNTTLSYGRIDSSTDNSTTPPTYGGDVKSKVMRGEDVDFAAVNFAYPASNKLDLGASFYHVSKVENGAFVGNEDTNNIYGVGFGYKLNDTLKLTAAYAKSDLDVKNDDAYMTKLMYKGAKQSAANSFGLWAGYSEQNGAAVINSTFDGVVENQKGYEVGVEYMLDKNIIAKFIYADGETVNADGTAGKDFKRYWSRVEFAF